MPSVAGRLPARWVIHAVGPVRRGGDHSEAGLLASADATAMRVAGELGARSVTLPAISLGVFGFPRAEGALIAGAAVADASAVPSPVERAPFVLRPDMTGEFRAALARVDLTLG